MDIQTDRALVLAGEAAVRYCTVTVAAPNPAPGTEITLNPAPGSQTDLNPTPGSLRPSANIAIVIDRSGSMAGSKLAMAKKAVTHAMRLLEERDRLALVCYDDQVDVLLEQAPASGEAKALAEKRLRATDARGSTNLSGGWEAGATQLHKEAGSKDPASEAAPSNHNARVLLLTDGLANAGETDPAKLAATATALKARGIATSTFGVGADFDETLLGRIATAGGGHFYFIEQAAQIPDILTSELGATLHIVARDARLVVRDSGGVDDGADTETTTLNDFPVTRHADGLHIHLGDLAAGQVVTLVLATRIASLPLDRSTGIGLHLVDRERALFGGEMLVSWRAADIEAHRAQPVNMDVIVSAATLFAERARAEALEANRHGDFDSAARILKNAAAHLRSMGGAADGDPALIDPRVAALIAELDHDMPRFAETMAPAMLKQAYFQSYTVRKGRDRRGKATITS